MKYLWLDCDPGHDDATAILLALHCKNIKLLGISTTSGNASLEWTTANAARCLFAFGASPEDVKVYRGVDQPLIMPRKHDAEIHGVDGLGGVEGLPDPEDPRVKAFIVTDDDGKPVPGIEGMVKAIKECWKNGAGHQVTVISTGPMTNVALFASAYVDLLPAVEEFVFMGGGVGMGNRSSVAEYNILCDPHAAAMVLNTPVKKTMMPINVTHTAIATANVHARILSPAATLETSKLPAPATNLRHTLSTLITYFAEAYKLTFGFNDGPPLHDCLTIAYVAAPELFKTTRHRVDIELNGTHSIGETVVDVWKYQKCDDTWGRNGRNCQVAEWLDVPGFFDLLIGVIAHCDTVSPLNVQSA